MHYHRILFIPLFYGNTIDIRMFLSFDDIKTEAAMVYTKYFRIINNLTMVIFVRESLKLIPTLRRHKFTL